MKNHRLTHVVQLIHFSIIYNKFTSEYPKGGQILLPKWIKLTMCLEYQGLGPLFIVYQLNHRDACRN